MKIAVIDTETTGPEPETAKVVEFACVVVEGEGHDWQIGNCYSSLVNPGVPIPVEASAIHHIVDADVAAAQPLDAVVAASPAGGCEWKVAHHVAYDATLLPMLKAPWLCTWRAALHTYPDAPSFKNQVLRYYLGLRLDMPVHWVMHRALPDAWVTAHVLMHMLRERTLEELAHLATQPVVLRTVGFGKHRGMAWADVPPDYLRWAKGQDFDSDVKYTVEHWIGVHAERRAQLFSGPAKA